MTSSPSRIQQWRDGVLDPGYPTVGTFPDSLETQDTYKATSDNAALPEGW